jgi:hypothetical protein
VGDSFRAALGITLLAAFFLTSFAAYDLGVAADGATTIWDDAVSLYEARVHAAGRLFGRPMPGDRRSFWIPMVLEGPSGRVYGKDYPGFPILLSIGSRLDLEWLVNPILGGLVVVATFALGRALRGTTTGLVAALLMASSPSLLALSSRYLNHVTCQLMLLLAAIAIARAGERRRPVAWGAAGGFAYGWALATRPYTAALMAVPIVAVLAWRALAPGADRAAGRRAGVAFAAAGLPWILGMVAWNVALTGDPLTTPYQLWKPENQPIVPGHGPGEYGPAMAFGYTLDLVVRLAREGLAVPWALSAVVVLPLAAARRLGRRELVLGLALVVLVGGHLLYRGIGNLSARIGGARFYSEALPALAILVASAAVELGHGLRPAWRRWAWLLPAALVVFAAVRTFPAEIARTRTEHDDPLWEGTRLLERHLERIGGGPRLVFVDVSSYNWRSTVAANRADYGGPWVAAVYLEPEKNRRVVEAFPGREPFLFRLARRERAVELTPYDPATDTTGPPPLQPYTRWKAKDRERRETDGKGAGG